MIDKAITARALNTRALELAAATAAALEAHERVCLERGQHTRETLQRIEKNVKDGFEKQTEEMDSLAKQVVSDRNHAVGLWLLAGGTFIVILLGVVSYFVARGMGHG